MTEDEYDMEAKYYSDNLRLVNKGLYQPLWKHEPIDIDKNHIIWFQPIFDVWRERNLYVLDALQLT